MTISQLYLFLAYCFTMLFFFNYSSPIFLWVIMELNLLFFISILFFFSEKNIKNESLNFIIYYFIVQSSSSIIFLSNFIFLDWFSFINIEFFLFLAILVKLGLFPAFFWVYNISYYLNFFSLTILLTLQKIPLLMILFSSSSLMLTFILILSLVSGSILLFFSKDFVSMVISSSISYSFFMYLLFINSFSLFLFFYMVYSIFLTFSLNFKNSLFHGANFLFLILVFSFFLGLPPLALFFYKFIFIESLISNFSLLELLLFWSLTFVSMIGYLKFFYSSFFFSYNMYYQHEFFLMKIIFFFLMLVFSFMFLI